MNNLTGENSYTENQLVDALKKRDNAAYRHLYMHYRGSLLNLITQIIPEREMANDVLQEVFVTVWKKIELYSPEKGRLYTWLLKLTRNTAINMTRSKNYKNSLKNEDISIYVNSNENKEVAVQNINLIGLKKEVAMLKEEFKMVVDLSYFQGFTHEEISKALHIPLGTVKTRLRSAIIELRKQFR